MNATKFRGKNLDTKMNKTTRQEEEKGKKEYTKWINN